MLLQPSKCHSTQEFFWDKETKTFIADASELRWPIGAPPLGRVYDDACDEGFTLVSHTTGKRVVMVLDEEDQSDDYSGGWRALTFIPATPGYMNKFKVTVIND